MATPKPNDMRCYAIGEDGRCAPERRIAELEAALRDLLEPTPDGQDAKLWSEKIKNAQAVLRRAIH